MDLFKLLGRVIGLFLRFVWRILPYVLMLAYEIIKLTTVTLIANFRGWQRTANDLADEWTDRIIKNKIFPINYDIYLKPVFLVWAYLTIIVGWVFLSYLTVFIVKWIF